MKDEMLHTEQIKQFKMIASQVRSDRTVKGWVFPFKNYMSPKPTIISLAMMLLY